MNKYLKISIGVAGVVALGAFWMFGQGKGSDVLNEVAIQDLPSTYSSVKASTGGDFNMLAMVSATPVTQNREGKLVNYAAKNIEIKDNNKKLIITLKDGLKYQDGSKVTAQDYKTAINLLVNPKSKASYAAYATDYIVGAQEVFDGKAKDVSGVKVLANNKYEIDLKGSFSFFKSTLMSGVWAPIKQSQVDKKGIDSFGNDYKDLLSSGEYKITKLAKEQYLEYTKIDGNVLSEDNDKNLPKVVKFKQYTTPGAIAADYAKKKVNSVAKSEVTDKTLKYAKDKKADDISEDPTLNFLANGGLDKNDMKALYLAIDKKYVINQFYYGNGIVRNTLTPSSYVGESSYNEPSKNEYDLQKAKSLLSSNLKNVRVQVRTGLPENLKAFIKYLANQWSKLGLTTQVVEKPFGPNDGTLGKNTKKRDYDVTLGIWGADYPDPNTFYGTLLGSNTGTAYSYWGNDKIKEYDSLIKKAVSAQSQNETSKNYVKAYELQKEEGQLMPLFERQLQRYIQPNGWKVHANGNVLKPVFWLQNK